MSDEEIRQEDQRVQNPALEVDLRLTMREWVIYWKTKYEEALHKIVGGQKAFKFLKEENEKLKREANPPGVNRKPLPLDEYLRVEKIKLSMEVNGEKKTATRKIEWNPEKNFPNDNEHARNILMREVSNGAMAVFHDLLEKEK